MGESIKMEDGGEWMAEEKCTVTITKGSVYVRKDGKQVGGKVGKDTCIELEKGGSIISRDYYAAKLDVKK
jgi:hypothetical protein